MSLKKAKKANKLSPNYYGFPSHLRFIFSSILIGTYARTKLNIDININIEM